MSVDADNDVAARGGERGVESGADEPAGIVEDHDGGRGVARGGRRNHRAGRVRRLTIGDQHLHALSREILLEDGGQSAIDKARFISDCQNNADKGIARKRWRNPTRWGRQGESSCDSYTAHKHESPRRSIKNDEG